MSMGYQKEEVRANAVFSEEGSGKQDELRVIIKHPGEKYGHETTITNSLEALQDAVGGFIEIVSCQFGRSRFLLICNEKGKLLDLEQNFRLQLDIICGTAIIAGEDSDEFGDVPISFSTWKRFLTQWGN